MEEVPDPRLGLTLSSDLIQDPTLLISFPTEGQRRQQFYFKIQKDRAAVVGDAVYYECIWYCGSCCDYDLKKIFYKKYF
ncbi:hypothetical protein NC651_002352 [Populus alba x Populus x berolinensis]|nr:hypothetical protein NC651_002352 [Populus alba x Populus x berolinensis]